MLSSSGHIAGIVNPPSKSAAHWTNDDPRADPELWLAGATRHGETWWEEWSRWIGTRAGARATPAPRGRKPRDVDPSPLFESYLVQVQTVVNAVDQLEK